MNKIKCWEVELKSRATLLEKIKLLFFKTRISNAGTKYKITRNKIYFLD